MKTQDAKPGHFYRISSSSSMKTFLVGKPDTVPESIHVWFYDIAGDKFYLYDKHFYYGQEIQEVEAENLKRNTIKHLFEEEDSYFAKNF